MPVRHGLCGTTPHVSDTAPHSRPSAALQALLLSHRRNDVRDTARYPPLMKPQVTGGREAGGQAQAREQGQRVVQGECVLPVRAAAATSRGQRARSPIPALPLGLPRQARMGKLKPRALRHLAQEQLGLAIQVGGRQGESSIHSFVNSAAVVQTCAADAVSWHAGSGACMKGAAGGGRRKPPAQLAALAALLSSPPSPNRVPPPPCLCLPFQEGEHSPVDDARAALYLYLKHRKEWERWVAGGGRQADHPAMAKLAAAGGLGGGGGKHAGQLSLADLAKSDYMADF